MLKTNLSVLMAERGLKIAELHDKTGISKTTLMALADNTGKGVQFDTVDKLCVYFGVTPKEFFSYSPYIFKYGLMEDDNFINISIKSRYYIKTFYLSKYIGSSDDFEFPLSDKSYDLWFQIHLEESETYRNNEFFDILDDLPTNFEIDFINEIKKFVFDYLSSNIGKHIEVNTQGGKKNILLDKETKVLLDIFLYEDQKFRRMEDMII